MSAVAGSIERDSPTTWRKPWVGLVTFGVAFLGLPLGHSIYAIIRDVFGPAQFVAASVLGVIGMLLTWAGIKRSEHSATWLGYLGGFFIWIGFFEFYFEFYAEVFALPTLRVGGVPMGGSSGMLQATLPIMLAMFLLYGLFNRETKCNLMRWLHRNAHFTPGNPTSALNRNFARITAIETIFVTWAIYLFWLYMLWFGVPSIPLYVAWVAFLIWTVYLMNRLVKMTRVAAALRYAIPVGNIFWGVIEMPSHMPNTYPEWWLKPAKYPLFFVVVLGLFTAGIIAIARAKRTPEPA